MKVLQSEEFFSSSKEEKEECTIGYDVSYHLFQAKVLFMLKFSAF